MRVALLANRSSIHTVRWANGLAGRGHEVHLISAAEGGDALDPRVRYHRLRWRAPAGYFLNATAVRRLLAEVRPDVMNAHFASGYGTLGRLSGFHPFVLSVWGSDVYDFPRRSPLHAALVRSNLLAADRVCSTSRVMAERTRSLAPLESIAVVPFGIDLERFEPSRSRERSDEVTIGTVKALAPKYGVDLLVRAFALVRDRLAAGGTDPAERLRLLVVGGGPDADRLRALAEDLGIAEVTHFVGPVPHAEVPAWLARLDVYVALSRLDSESFGVAVLEASAMGLPVVVSNAGGLPEVVEHGVTGLVVPRDDHVAAAEALMQLVRDPQLRRRLGDAGRRHVEDRYSWAACIDALESVYEGVVE